jgi:hypothetical protein
MNYFDSLAKRLQLFFILIVSTLPLLHSRTCLGIVFLLLGQLPYGTRLCNRTDAAELMSFVYFLFLYQAAYIEREGNKTSKADKHDSADV